MRLPLYSTGDTQVPGNCSYCSLLKQQSPSRVSRFFKAAAMPPSSAVHDCSFPSTPGKVKMEKSNYFTRVSSRWQSLGPGKIFFWSFSLLSAFLLLGLFYSKSSSPSPSSSSSSPGGIFLQNSFEQSLQQKEMVVSWGGSIWEKHVRHSGHAKRDNGMVVLVTGAAGFVGTHVSLALKKRGDGVIGLDNFNSYYDPFLKRARQGLLEKQGVFIVEGDINNAALLRKLFDVIAFTHVMHLAAQAGVRYAMENPGSYVHSNIAGFVNLLEVCKEASPQPAIVWASSSSVYGLNSRVPFSESDRTDQPASLYAATKKAGEEIAHTYNHIYGLSITGLRFFTVYGPWGRPDMAYFFFTKAILQGKPVNIYQGPDRTDLARDFTYIDDIVKGCVGALDTATPSTGTGGKKRGVAQLRVYNLGNTSPVTVPSLVDILEKHLKAKAKRNVVRMPRNGDVPFTHANVTLARVELGYNPTTDLQTGLKKFVKWYQLYYGGSSGSGSGSSKRRGRG